MLTTENTDQGAFWRLLAPPEGAAVTFLFGLVVVVTGAVIAALINAYLNRRRDDRLRRDEMKAVAAALYGEIVLLRREVASLARIVAATYFAEGTGSPLKFDNALLERNTLKDPILYAALASKLGMLPTHLVLAITKFHADYEAVRDGLPMLLESESRRFTYSIGAVLDPAHDAVIGSEPALRELEMLVGVKKPADKPDMENVLRALSREDGLAQLRQTS